MPRARTIKAAFFTDSRVGAVRPYARLLFQGLWCLADRNGRLPDDPDEIGVQILPYDLTDPDYIDAGGVAASLDELAAVKLIRRYTVEGCAYIEIPKFGKHQRLYDNEKELYPEPVATELEFITTSSNKIQQDLISSQTLRSKIIRSKKEDLKDKGSTKKEDPTLAVVAQFKSGTHFRCSNAEIAALTAEDGPEAVATRIQVINDYCAANGRTYKSYAAAYRNFRKRDLEAAKGLKLHLHIHRQETNVDRMKSEGFFNGPGTNGEVVGGSSIRIPGVSSAEGTRPKLVAKAPEVFRRGGEGSD